MFARLHYLVPPVGADALIRPFHRFRDDVGIVPYRVCFPPPDIARPLTHCPLRHPQLQVIIIQKFGKVAKTVDKIRRNAW